MPAPARTSTAAIVAAARAVIEEDGLDALTMQRVATDVGVRAPSLYKRVRDRAELVHRVTDQVASELGERLEASIGTDDAAGDLRSLIAAFRAVALGNPRAYPLLFDPRLGRTSPAARERSVAPVLRVVTHLTGDADALPAARLLTAWASGFVAMELAGAFQLDGDLEGAWDYGLEHLVAAIAADPRRDRPS